MNENDKLHDALERNSELIKALRNEIATKDKRIGDLEAALNRHAERSNNVDAAMMRKDKRIGELEQTVLYLTAQCVEQLSEGKEYSEGCKP